MALSNIGREPRREIIESAIGIIAAGGWLYAAYFISKSIDPYHVTKYEPPWAMQITLLMLIIGLVGPVVLLGLLHLTHAFGEVVCGWMRALGADPRPRQRY